VVLFQVIQPGLQEVDLLVLHAVGRAEGNHFLLRLFRRDLRADVPIPLS
jgi:hypothetical protein